MPVNRLAGPTIRGGMGIRLAAVVMTLAAASAWGGLAWLVVTIPTTRPLATAAFYVFGFTALRATAYLLR